MTIHAFLDETFDYKNNYFYLVSIVFFQLNDEIEKLSGQLFSLENRTKKRKIKWHKCGHQRRRLYVEGINRLDFLKGKIYYGFGYGIDQNREIEFIANMACRAISKFCEINDTYEMTLLYVDGLSISKKSLLSKQVRQTGTQKIKIRSIKKDENNEYIRLVDSICGLIRDAIEDRPVRIGLL